VFVGHIVPPAIGPLSDHPLTSSPTNEMYIPRHEGCVLEIPHRLKIRQLHSILVKVNLTLQVGFVDLKSTF